MTSGRMCDASGKDVTDYMTIVPAAQYDEVGRVIGYVQQAWPYTQARIDAGERFIKGESGFNPETGQSALYVDVTGPTPCLKKRPTWAGPVTPGTVVPAQEAVIKALPACTVTFTGPASGTQKHPGGDLKIGFTLPGTYSLTFEAFPYLPTTSTLTVAPAISTGVNASVNANVTVNK